MKIVILDGYTVNPGDLSWEAFEELGDTTVYDRTTANEVITRAASADAVLTNKVVFTEETIDLLPRLKYIGVLATGYNVVDIEAATRRGITVTNIPAYSTDSVAQTTFAHILNLTNRIAHYARQNRNGKWSMATDFCYYDTPLPELAGKTLGIVGLGNIGRKVACIGLAFGMKVCAYTSKAADSLPVGINKVGFDELLASSDIISLHCPLTPETCEIINKSTLDKVKRGALIINTARGPLVNEADVAEALSDGRLGGYGADVSVNEPPSKDNPLLKAENAYLTPHIAWATPEARARLLDTAAANLKAYKQGSPINIIKQ